MKKILTAVAVGGVVLAAATAAVHVYGPSFGVYLFPPSPAEVGRTTVSQMDMGLYADTPEWAQQRERSLAALAGVQTWEELSPILDEAVKVAGGKHSFMLSQQDFDQAQSEVIAPSHSVSDGVLTLSLPAFMGSPDQGQAYADSVGAALYSDGVCGVIVDLRENSGGDMGPMLAGLSPLLPDGVATSFVVHGTETPSMIREGSTHGGGTPTALSDYRGKLSLPVAVLQGPRTASSGEQTLLSFRGRDGARSFGMPSAGYASVNQIFPVAQDLQMALTIGTTKDRTGTEYAEEPIPADVELSEDEAPAAALEWLRKQGCPAK